MLPKQAYSPAIVATFILFFQCSLGGDSTYQQDESLLTSAQIAAAEGDRSSAWRLYTSWLDELPPDLSPEAERQAAEVRDAADLIAAVLCSELLVSGVILQESRAWRESLRPLKRARRYCAHPAVPLATAFAHLSLDRCSNGMFPLPPVELDSASLYFREYLELAPEAEDRTQVVQLLNGLETKIQERRNLGRCTYNLDLSFGPSFGDPEKLEQALGSAMAGHVIGVLEDFKGRLRQEDELRNRGLWGASPPQYQEVSVEWGGGAATSTNRYEEDVEDTSENGRDRAPAGGGARVKPSREEMFGGMETHRLHPESREAFAQFRRALSAGSDLESFIGVLPAAAMFGSSPLDKPVVVVTFPWEAWELAVHKIGPGVRARLRSIADQNEATATTRNWREDREFWRRIGATVSDPRP